MPRRVRPKFPKEWHVPNDPKLWITWEHMNDKLAKETVYWISTAGSRGRPHAVPVWGIWTQNSFYFETDPNSVKGRNLSNNGTIVVHVQDGNDTVILEGRARKEKRSEKLNRLKKEYTRKYRYTPDWSNERNQIVFRVEPRIAHAWKALRMHRSLVKFIF
jgi:nitroimidazol reductase NimA-like FMN-containing flavoprotein (pyridoxamine 5'-phosphate oxidase superfamily)